MLGEENISNIPFSNVTYQDNKIATQVDALGAWNSGKLFYILWMSFSLTSCNIKALIVFQS